MTHSDVTEDLANNKEKGEEIQQAQAGPAVTDQVPYSYLDLIHFYSSYVVWERYHYNLWLILLRLPYTFSLDGLKRWKL